MSKKRKVKSVKKSPAKSAGELTFIVVQGVDAKLKAKYMKAAGGPGKMSAWIRDTLARAVR